MEAQSGQNDLAVIEEGMVTSDEPGVTLRAGSV